MAIIFDKSKKNDNELVLEKRISIRINKIDYYYFMTNDFTIMSDKIESLGFQVPNEIRFQYNPTLAFNVRNKMRTIGACWSITVTTTMTVLNYYIADRDEAYIMIFRDLSENTSESRFFKAIVNNQSEIIKEIIMHGFDIEQDFQNGKKPLMLACQYDAYESIKLLLTLGANINSKDANEQTPLMYAIFYNSIEALKLLLSYQELNIEETCYKGATALYWAVYYGNFEAVQELISVGANPNIVTYDGNPALHTSIKKGYIEIAELLIKSGADVSLRSSTEETPLMTAAHLNNKHIVKVLLENGADFHEKALNSVTALMMAVDANAIDIIRLFISSQEIDEEEYTNAVVISARKGNIDSTSLLLEYSKESEKLAFIAMISACKENKPDIIHVCMDFNCNINDSLHFGITPLMIACFTNSKKVVAQLLAYEADVNKTDNDGMTALMYAASKNNQIILNLLMRYGADRNLSDKKGKDFRYYSKVLDNRTYSQMVLDRLKEKQLDSNRISNIPEIHQSFMERLNWYIQKYFERYPNNKYSDIYKSGEISKQTFSKIMSNRSNDFRPKKDTIFQLALGLKLTSEETEDLLKCAGYILSEKNKKDLIVKELLTENNYKLFEWNNRIYEITGKALLKND